MPAALIDVVRQADSKDIIEIIGLSLFGRRWQSDMARYLGVDARTVRRWAVGDGQPSKDHMKALSRACKIRSDISHYASNLAEDFYKPTWPSLPRWQPRFYAEREPFSWKEFLLRLYAKIS